MSDFAGFYEEFIDWYVEATFYKRQELIVNGVPQPETDTLLGTISVGFWVGTAVESNQNDQFVQNKTGKMVVNKSDLSFTIDNQSIAIIEGVEYNIEATDNVGHQGEILLLTFRKEL